jgi:hypothetical protein
VVDNKYDMKRLKIIADNTVKIGIVIIIKMRMRLETWLKFFESYIKQGWVLK